MRIFGVHATAIILAVQTVFFRQTNRTGVPVAFFEVRRQKLNAVFPARLFADGVYYVRVFMRRNGKRGAKILKSAVFGDLGGFGKALSKTNRATPAAFFFLFKPDDRVEKLARRISAADKIYLPRVIVREKTLYFVEP